MVDNLIETIDLDEATESAIEAIRDETKSHILITFTPTDEGRLITTSSINKNLVDPKTSVEGLAQALLTIVLASSVEMNEAMMIFINEFAIAGASLDEKLPN